MTLAWKPTLGATYQGNQCTRFCVWAPEARKVELHLQSPENRLVPMEPIGRGYYRVVVEGVAPRSLYQFRLDSGNERPDPASRSQPHGVHGPSQVVDPHFAWTDAGWFGLPLRDYILYELHVGTFTPEGTFDAVISHLDDLKDLGITALELMPVAQFPGSRNWGYDGVYPYAAQSTYGGAEGLRRLVDACHSRGLAVVLDVVYNHLGPEGNYLADFGPYFTDRYRTPWGPAINFDGPHSDEVRRFFVENALYWIADLHVDALRLDAIHTIIDNSATTFLAELAEAVHQQADAQNRRAYLIAESDLNDVRAVRPAELGGYGLDAVFGDDLHHSLHALLTGETVGYYRDFGKLRHLAAAIRESFVYSGQRSAHRHRRHGASARGVPAFRFVVCSQNHDQVGNRMLGERLTALVDFEELKLAAAAVLLSPYLPMLFMGEEYGETAPFQFFVSHSDPSLVEAVRKGRREEFAAFAWQGEPPDPQDEATFLRSKLDHSLRVQGQHRVLLEFYKELIRLRKELPALASVSRDDMRVVDVTPERVLFVTRWHGDEQACAIFNFGDAPASVTLAVPFGSWRKALDSSEPRWSGEGGAASPVTLPAHVWSEGQVNLALPPKSVALFVSEPEDGLDTRL